MARLWTCGFELQSTVALMEVLAVTGTPSISTTMVRGGGASLRSNPTAATAYVEQQLDPNGVNGRSYHRLYLRIATLPSATCTVYAVGQSGYFPVAVQLTTTGTLRLRDTLNAVDVGTASAALATGTWYRIELDVAESGATGTTRAVIGYLDGANFSGTALIAGSTGYSRVRAGVQTTATADIYIDDIAVNNPSGTVQNGLPGPGRVVHLRPAGAGDANGWATAVGGTAGAANNWTRVSETPPDDATSYNQSTTTGTTTVDEFAVSSPTTAGIGADDTISVVHVGGRIGSDATTAASIVYRLKSQSGGTVAESPSVSVAIAGWRTHKAAMPYVPQLTSYTDPQTGTAWTRARLAGAQIGYRGDVSQTTVRRVSGLWATVEYQPRTVVQIGLAREKSSAKSVKRIGILAGKLTDDFADGVVDSARWPESYGGVTETGGRARVPCGLDYAAYASGKAYRLTGSQVLCRLYPATGPGGVAEAWSQVLITTLTAGTDAVIEYNGIAGTLAMSSRVGYFDPDYLAIPYDPVAHAWVRIRESGGSLLWETSPDGVTWTTRRTSVSPGWVSDGTLQVQLIAHRDGGTPDFAEYASFNAAPTTTVIPLGMAVETGTTRPIGHARTAHIAAAPARTRAHSVGHTRTIHVSTGRTSDHPQTVKHARTFHAGTAREDTQTFPLAAGRALRLGAARVADGARPIQAGRLTPLAPADTSEAAHSVTAARRIRLGTAATVDTARDLTVSGAVLIGAAHETSDAGPVTARKALTLGAAPAVERGSSLRGHKTATVGVSAVIGSAQPLSAHRLIPVTTSVESTRALAVATARTVRLGAAVEAADARALMVSGALVLGAARVRAAGWALVSGKRKAVGTTRTTESARTLVTSRTVVIGAAHETTDALTVLLVRRAQLGVAGSNDTALPVVGSSTLNVTVAPAAEASHPLSVGKLVHLGPALEAEATWPARVRRGVDVAAARESDAATVMGQARTARLDTARLGEIAASLAGRSSARLGTARQATAATPMHPGRILRLGAARQTARAVLLTAGHVVGIGAARCAVTAGPVRQPFQTRLIRTARCSDTARAVPPERQRPADRLTAATHGPVLTPAAVGPRLSASTAGPALNTFSTTGG
ncbi:hypothetical protein ACIQNU_02305 [Streptomyces sp. NPDC091292]|uniref:hypothetical protein n=1 Tax=Streptomyces sp. NPDC091292 TaxID=3365991 RepID=UPI00381E44E7